MPPNKCLCCSKKPTVKGFCRKHYLANWRSLGRIKYLWQNLKGNAKRRGKFFDLTLDQFEAFCERTGYDKFVGTTATSFTIDRIDNNLGYTNNNIRSITLSENAHKGNRGHEMFSRPERQDDDLPF